MSEGQLIRRVLKPALFVAALVPFTLLVWRAAGDDLGANPIEAITHETGVWGLRFLVLTLAITPLRGLTRWHAIIRFRRMLGLFAFFYACLHLVTFVVLDHFFDMRQILADVAKRPFITAGMLGFVTLVPLAVTSTAGWIRRLGGGRWQALHRLIYVSASAVVFHYWWLVKADTLRPSIYGLIIGALLVFRLIVSYGHRLFRTRWRRAPRARRPRATFSRNAPPEPGT
ncbi:MAG: sulfoxide reductase heme-binding subunit YedZ [Acidobacteria bacterium]|nr:sulfoxide reductase heme-binding subunit YedZ [Acidobacteriota bacterium]